MERKRLVQSLTEARRGEDVQKEGVSNRVQHGIERWCEIDPQSTNSLCTSTPQNCDKDQIRSCMWRCFLKYKMLYMSSYYNLGLNSVPINSWSPSGPSMPASWGSLNLHLALEHCPAYRRQGTCARGMNEWLELRHGIPWFSSTQKRSRSRLLF